MPETTPDAEQSSGAPGAPELEKLTKRELVEQVLAQRDAADRYAARVDELLADRRRPAEGRARPEDAMVVSALLDLHRTVEARAESTIRGRSPAIGNRYLEAARALGDELVVAILGPAPKG